MPACAAADPVEETTSQLNFHHHYTTALLACVNSTDDGGRAPLDVETKAILGRHQGAVLGAALNHSEVKGRRVLAGGLQER